MHTIYEEGRCTECGRRVTVDRQDHGHTRDGRWCGPVETDRPLTVRDHPPEGWVERAPR